MRSTLSDDDAPNRCAAIQAGLACSAVHAMELLKRATLSSAIDVIRDGRSAMVNRKMKHLSELCMKSCRALF